MGTLMEGFQKSLLLINPENAFIEKIEAACMHYNLFIFGFNQYATRRQNC